MLGGQGPGPRDGRGGVGWSGGGQHSSKRRTWRPCTLPPPPHLLWQYVSELVRAVVEAPLRPADVGTAVTVCSELHQRYADFGTGLGQALAKTFSSKLPAGVWWVGGGAGCRVWGRRWVCVRGHWGGRPERWGGPQLPPPCRVSLEAGVCVHAGLAGCEHALLTGALLRAEDDRAFLKRQRSTLRLLAELLAAGVVTEVAPLISIVRELVRRGCGGMLPCLMRRRTVHSAL